LIIVGVATSINFVVAALVLYFGQKGTWPSQRLGAGVHGTANEADLENARLQSRVTQMEQLELREPSEDAFERGYVRSHEVMTMAMEKNIDGE
jgi:hypothetical protein